MQCIFQDMSPQAVVLGCSHEVYNNTEFSLKHRLANESEKFY